VPRKLAALKGRLEFGPPKSAAGVRTVALPRAAADELATHLGTFVGSAPDALVFTGDKGALLRSGNFGRATDWPRTVVKVGLPAGFHFHDLRHTGNTIAAAAGASTPRTDAPDRPRLDARRTDLPARHQRAGPGDRGRHGPQDCRRGRPQDQEEGQRTQTARRPVLAREWPARSNRCQWANRVAATE